MSRGNLNNLKPVQTKEEARERGRKGGIKSGEIRREKKTMRETAKAILSMKVVGEKNRATLEKFGIEESDQNYQTAAIVMLLQRALVEGDTSSIRLLAELTGDINRFGFPMDEETEVSSVPYPTVNIPNNGRDKKITYQIAPQAGPQTMFMASSADIVIYGGAAGGGKTYALLLEALRHKDVKGFGAVIFRHNYNQITAEGGLWDASQNLFSQVPDAHPRKSPKLHWRFDGGAKLNFAHIEREEDLKSWQGTEIAYIGFDELTHFTKHQFLYMLSRNRSTCGIRPYMRATCNPDSDSWVAEFISWWIDQETGFAIPERSGQIRWMCVLNNSIMWGDSPEELAAKYEVDVRDCKSVTFIASRLEDNRILMEKDPGYLANLKALPEVDMERLLKGNWKIKASAGKFFKRTHIGPARMLTEIPKDIVYWCRAWDIAATDETEEGDPDFTASVLMGKRSDGTFVIADVTNDLIKAGDVENMIATTSLSDRAKYGAIYHIHLPQDPGAAGKIVVKNYIKMLAGFNVSSDPVSGSKELRATPLSAQWQNGNVYVLIADWNEMYFNQMESFPASKHDDMVDASSDAFNECAEGGFNIDDLL